MTTYRQGNGEVHTVKALGPTERTDGTPLSVDEIAHYIRTLSFEGGLTTEQVVNLVEDVNTPEYDGSFDEQINIDDQTPGIYHYTYRTVDTGGRESVESNELILEILPPLANPAAPTVLGLA